MSKKLKSFLSVERPVEFKPIQRTNPILKKNIPPKLDVWFRIKGESIHDTRRETANFNLCFRL